MSPQPACSGLAFVLLLASVGCTRAPSPLARSDDAVQAPAREDGKATGAPEAPPAPTPVADPREEALEKACQAVLDAPQLAQYTTPIPERIPLRLMSGGPCEGTALEKNGAPVRFDGDDRALAVKELAVEGKTARARIEYRGEGLVGELWLEQTHDGFRVVRGSVAER